MPAVPAADPKIPGACVLDVFGPESCALLAPPKLRLLKPPAPPCENGRDEEDSSFLPKTPMTSVAGWLKRLAPLIPVFVFGGGPAGVVELAKKFVVGLLVGVVVLVWPEEDAFEPKLKNPPVLPPPLAAPKRFGF